MKIKTDFHTHILPGIDDGSRSTDMSVQMLKKEEEQGTERVIATPHFYPSEESLEDFLLKRNDALRKVRELYDGKVEIVPGAEVYIYDGFSHCNNLEELCIEGTNVILLEMPDVWTSRLLDDIFEIRDQGFCPVIAHIDRYINHRNRKLIDVLVEENISMQANADFIISRRTRKKALKMLRNTEIQFIGSDCHNMTTRVPNMGECNEYLDSDITERVNSISEKLFDV